MNPAPHLIPGHAYDMSYHALAEAHRHLRYAIQNLFEPRPRLVGYTVADVGSFGDEAWNEVKGLLSKIKAIEYHIRLRDVMSRRYDPDRKERLRARRKQQQPLKRPLWEPVSMGMDERIWKRRITED